MMIYKKRSIFIVMSALIFACAQPQKVEPIKDEPFSFKDTIIAKEDIDTPKVNAPNPARNVAETDSFVIGDQGDSLWMNAKFLPPVEKRLPDGIYEFTHLEMEFAASGYFRKKIMVTIKGDMVYYTVYDQPVQNQIRLHYSGQWILSEYPYSEFTKGIGGCSGIDIIKFSTRTIESC